MGQISLDKKPNPDGAGAGQKGAGQRGSVAAERRAARLAEQLRANLKRRKSGGAEPEPDRAEHKARSEGSKDGEGS